MVNVLLVDDVILMGVTVGVGVTVVVSVDGVRGTPLKSAAAASSSTAVTLRVFPDVTSKEAQGGITVPLGMVFVYIFKDGLVHFALHIDQFPASASWHSAQAATIEYVTVEHVHVSFPCPPGTL